MGRPLKKDRFGTDVIGTPVSNTGIKVQSHDGSSLSAASFIIKQRGAKTFVITTNGTDRQTCVLQSTTPAGAGQMLMMGFTEPYQADANAVPIAKITKRVATDFSGNRYTWYLENDSSTDVIVLTAL